jgi:hypothetical protein
MTDLLQTLLRGPRECPGCGAANFRGTTWCHACGERIRNRNPLARFLVTVMALAIIGAVAWFTLTR